MINDVAALRGEGAMQAAADLGVPVCLMHMQGEPRTMQQKPRYDDVVADVAAFLESRIAACVEAGIGEELIVVDPGTVRPTVTMSSCLRICDNCVYASGLCWLACRGNQHSAI
jgi:dihydropteroate synthase